MSQLGTTSRRRRCSSPSALGVAGSNPVFRSNATASEAGISAVCALGPAWFGSEAMWKSNYNALVGYLRDSVPRWDETYRPSGVRPTDAEVKLWNPLNSPAYVQIDLRREDCFGHLARPLIIVHGGADPIVSTGEAEGYKNLVAKTIGRREAEKLLAVYYIPGMGHGGAQFDRLVPAQIDALEAMIDYQQSNGSRHAPDLSFIGTYPEIYPREPVTGPGTSLGFYDLPHHDDDQGDD